MASDRVTRGLLGVLVAVMLACAGMGAAAQRSTSTLRQDFQKSTSTLRRDLDVHVGVQGERIANIEKACARNEKTLQRIEELLRNQ